MNMAIDCSPSVRGGGRRFKLKHKTKASLNGYMQESLFRDSPQRSQAWLGIGLAGVLSDVCANTNEHSHCILSSAPVNSVPRLCQALHVHYPILFPLFYRWAKSQKRGDLPEGSKSGRG